MTTATQQPVLTLVLGEDVRVMREWMFDRALTASTPQGKAKQYARQNGFAAIWRCDDSVLTYTYDHESKKMSQKSYKPGQCTVYTSPGAQRTIEAAERKAAYTVESMHGFNDAHLDTWRKAISAAYTAGQHGEIASISLTEWRVTHRGLHRVYDSDSMSRAFCRALVYMDEWGFRFPEMCQGTKSVEYPADGTMAFTPVSTPCVKTDGASNIVTIMTLPDGRRFPAYDGEPLSWDAGLYPTGHGSTAAMAIAERAC